LKELEKMKDKTHSSKELKNEMIEENDDHKLKFECKEETSRTKEINLKDIANTQQADIITEGSTVNNFNNLLKLEELTKDVSRLTKENNELTNSKINSEISFKILAYESEKEKNNKVMEQLELTSQQLGNIKENYATLLDEKATQLKKVDEILIENNFLKQVTTAKLKKSKFESVFRKMSFSKKKAQCFIKKNRKSNTRN